MKLHEEGCLRFLATLFADPIWDAEYGPPTQLLSTFKPCVVEHKELCLTEMILEDTHIVWRPWRGTRGMGHMVDLGYDVNGKLVGIQIWDNVAQLPSKQQ